MAILNENRNRIPLVEVLPVDGDDEGIRGQLRMNEVNGDTTIAICITGDEDAVSTLTVDPGVNGNDAVIYTSIPVGAEGTAITIEHLLDSGAELITVIGSAITVHGIIGGATTTATQVADAINLHAEASLLVSAVAEGTGGGFIAVAAAAPLAGGTGVFASQTFNVDLVVTAVADGRAGNDIEITIIDTTGAQYVVATAVSDTSIVITGDSAVHTTANMASAMNSNNNVAQLVSAVGSTTSLAAAAAAPLVGGASLALWGSLTVA